ncbi:MAG: hypothetical protein ABI758_04015 [Candidatus Woesebacteria bacterium]
MKELPAVNKNRSIQELIKLGQLENVLDMYAAFIELPNGGSTKVFCDNNYIMLKQFLSHIKLHRPDLVRHSGQMPEKRSPGGSFEDEPGEYTGALLPRKFGIIASRKRS